MPCFFISARTISGLRLPSVVMGSPWVDGDA
jgi:hypothetical protein